LLASLALCCCSYTKIGEINADPSRYVNKTVHVEGRVTSSFGALSVGGYQVEDSTGKILVVSNRSVPAKGTEVAVSGRVMEGVTLAGRSFGTSIQETDRHTR